MIHLFEYLKVKDVKRNAKEVEDERRAELPKPPMSYHDAWMKVGSGLKDFRQKMDDWHAGKRRENIKACSDAKLIVYYDYCKQQGYTEQCEIIEEIANSKGWTFNKN